MQGIRKLNSVTILTRKAFLWTLLLGKDYLKHICVATPRSQPRPVNSECTARTPYQTNTFVGTNCHGVRFVDASVLSSNYFILAHIVSNRLFRVVCLIQDKSKMKEEHPLHHHAYQAALYCVHLGNKIKTVTYCNGRVQTKCELILESKHILI